MNAEGLRKQERLRTLSKVEKKVRKLSMLEAHLRCDMYCRQDIEALEDIIEALKEMIDVLKGMRS